MFLRAFAVRESSFLFNPRARQVLASAVLLRIGPTHALAHSSMDTLAWARRAVGSDGVTVHHIRAEEQCVTVSGAELQDELRAAAAGAVPLLVIEGIEGRFDLSGEEALSGFDAHYLENVRFNEFVAILSHRLAMELHGSFDCVHLGSFEDLELLPMWLKEAGVQSGRLWIAHSLASSPHLLNGLQQLSTELPPIEVRSTAEGLPFPLNELHRLGGHPMLEAMNEALCGRYATRAYYAPSPSFNSLQSRICALRANIALTGSQIEPCRPLFEDGAMDDLGDCARRKPVPHGPSWHFQSAFRN